MTIPSWQISRPLCSIKTCPLVASIAFQASFSVLFYILASLPFTCPLKVPTKSPQSPLKVPESPSKSLEKAFSSLKCPYTKSAAVIRKAPLINSQLEEAPIFNTVSVILDMASADESNCNIFLRSNCVEELHVRSSVSCFSYRDGQTPPLLHWAGHPTMHHYLGCPTHYVGCTTM